eukprot:10609667-Lingulodinium_polyedra.AAC.1
MGPGLRRRKGRGRSCRPGPSGVRRSPGPIGRKGHQRPMAVALVAGRRAVVPCQSARRGPGARSRGRRAG